MTYIIKDEIGNLGKFADEHKNKQGDIVVNLKLTLNEFELDIESFIKKWQGEVHKSINEKAKNLIDDKFTYIEEILDDLKTRIKPEIKKRLEDWEKKE